MIGLMFGIRLVLKYINEKLALTELSEDVLERKWAMYGVRKVCNGRAIHLAAILHDKRRSLVATTGLQAPPRVGNELSALLTG